MAREIKFRAWDKKTNKIASWELILKECNRFSFLILPSWEFMQFTGLLDKNGKEIYEGDIGIGNPWDEKSGSYEILWNDKSAHFWMRGIGENKQRISFGNDNNKEIEIIGNKFENPELLK